MGDGKQVFLPGCPQQLLGAALGTWFLLHIAGSDPCHHPAHLKNGKCWSSEWWKGLTELAVTL